MISAARPPFAGAHPLVRLSVPLSICAALVSGWAFVHHRTMVEAAAALLTTLPLLLCPRLRVVFIVFGGLLIFHSSATLTPPKLYFLLGAAVAVAGALLHLPRLARDPLRRDLAPLFAASRAFAVLIFISLIVSIAYVTPHRSWLRDVSPYLLVAAAPLLAFDAQAAWSERALRRLLVLAGLAGTAAFAVQWLSNRHIVSISTVFGLPTFLLGAALFSYAVAVVLEGDRKRLGWFLLASAILVGLIATGTRSSGILLAAPIAIIFGGRRRFVRRSIRLAIVIPAAAFIAFLGVQSLIRLTAAHQDVFQARVHLLRHTGTASDQSYTDRLNQTKAAWREFARSPVFGVGPGYQISWVDPTGAERSSAFLDSPVEYIAKFGLLGLWPLVLLIWAVQRTLRLLRRRTGERTIGQLAIIGFGAIFICWWVLGVPFDDKGFASGLLLLLALAFSEAAAMSRPR